MKKQYKTQFNKKIVFFSMFIWSLIYAGIYYYMYNPFKNIDAIQYIGAYEKSEFILVSSLIFLIYRSFIQTAWKFSINERISNTLELVILSQTNLHIILFGNVLASLMECIWMYFVFALTVNLILKEQLIIIIGKWILILGILLIPAILFGVLLNYVFLSSRNTSGFFAVLEEPLETFGAINMPIKFYPLGIAKLSSILPVTWSVEIARKYLILNIKMYNLLKELGYLMVISIIICILILIVERYIYNRLLLKGQLNFF